MRNLIKVLAGTAIVLALGALAGCSDFDEMKSRRLQQQAQSLIKEGNQAAGEELLARLAERYPDSQAAAEARTYLLQQANLRGQKLRQEYAPLVDSYTQVLDGFRALFGRYPATVAELDSGGYIFDSDYLVEITPPGFELYLCLTGDAQGFRLWGVRKDAMLGFSVSGGLPLELVKPEHLLIQLEGFETLDKKGPLTLLRRKS
ncbi:MAG: hypothetical protein FDZ69_05190 [Deltaproteobacteria bacterium]|nr:MAG: hypothetical protein FDZ69_05190 [Deltaproteobacteria bacterium]